MREIRNQYGDGHLIFVLRCIRESRNNRDELWSETIGAISAQRNVTSSICGDPSPGRRALDQRKAST
jgi:hypothetical protein